MNTTLKKLLAVWQTILTVIAATLLLVTSGTVIFIVFIGWGKVEAKRTAKFFSNCLDEGAKSNG